MKGCAMMSHMMQGGFGHGWLMAAVGILVLAGLILGVAALVKYLFFSDGR